MKIKYLGSEKEKRVNWIGTSEFTVFDPVGETTDERGNRLLNNPDLKGQFELVTETKVAGVIDVPKPSFVCDVCGVSAKSKVGLISHKRKHKEKVT